MSTELTFFIEIEVDRLNFISERDGLEAAITFAKRTLVTYRKTLVDRRDTNTLGRFARDNRHRRQSFAGSYLAFKRFLVDHS